MEPSTPTRAADLKLFFIISHDAQNLQRRKA